MGAFKGVTIFFSVPLTDIAKKLKYTEDNILVLQGNTAQLQVQFPEIYKNMQSCKHHADRRSPIEYAQDLVASWIFEDYFVEHFTSDKYTISLSGADKKRKILASSKTSAASDYLISSDKETVKMELMNDYTGFWIKTHKLHLRDDKYNKLKDTQSLLLAVATTTKQFVLFDFRKAIPSRYIASHFPYGGKPAYELTINPNDMLALNKENMEKAILKCLTEN